MIRPNYVFVAAVIIAYVSSFATGAMQILIRVGSVIPILVTVGGVVRWACRTNRLDIADNRSFLVGLFLAIVLLPVIVHRVPDTSLLIPSFVANLIVALILALTVFLAVSDWL